MCTEDTMRIQAYIVATVAAIFLGITNADNGCNGTWLRQGCYLNTVLFTVTYDKSYFSSVSSGITRDTCNKRCIDSGYVLAGLAGESTCSCGNCYQTKPFVAYDCGIGPFSAEVWACVVTGGAAPETCSSNQPLPTPALTVATATCNTWVKQGCISDPNHSLVATDYTSNQFVSANLKVSDCQKYCADRRYKISVLSMGTTCTCGACYQYSPTTADAGACSVCSGSMSDTCDGSLAADVYACIDANNTAQPSVCSTTPPAAATVTVAVATTATAEATSIATATMTTAAATTTVAATTTHAAATRTVAATTTAAAATTTVAATTTITATTTAAAATMTVAATTTTVAVTTTTAATTTKTVAATRLTTVATTIPTTTVSGSCSSSCDCSCCYTTTVATTANTTTTATTVTSTTTDAASTTTAGSTSTNYTYVTPTGCKSGSDCTYEAYAMAVGTNMVFNVRAQITSSQWTGIGWSIGGSISSCMSYGNCEVLAIEWGSSGRIILQDGGLSMAGWTVYKSNMPFDYKVYDGTYIWAQFKRTLASVAGGAMNLAGKSIYFWYPAISGDLDDSSGPGLPSDMPVFGKKITIPTTTVATTTTTAGSTCKNYTFVTPTGCESGSDCAYEAYAMVVGTNIVFNVRAQITSSQWSGIGWSTGSSITSCMSAGICEAMAIEWNSTGPIILEDGGLSLTGWEVYKSNMPFDYMVYDGTYIWVQFKRTLASVATGAKNLAKSIYFWYPATSGDLDDSSGPGMPADMPVFGKKVTLPTRC